MAKRRKEGAEVEESLDFQIPKFDEEGFMKKERRNIKTLFISFLFGLLIAVICFGFWVLLDGSFLRWELVLLVGVVNSVWIKYLFVSIPSWPSMAKRRKEGTDPAEPLDFQIPKFDEEGFMKKERRNIKTLFISFLFGLLIAVICFGFWVLLDGSFLRWELVLLVGVVNSIWIKYLVHKAEY